MMAKRFWMRPIKKGERRGGLGSREKREISDRARDDAMRVQAPLDWTPVAGRAAAPKATDVDDLFDRPEDDD